MNNHGIDPLENDSLEKWERRMQQIFAAYIASNPMVHQVRYIGLADGGRELVRVERHADGRITLTPRDNLQRKGDRAYIRSAMELKPGEVALSDFDLEQEHGRISEPRHPALRAIAPVHTPSGHLFGFVIINADARLLLEEAVRTLPEATRAFVTNAQGQYLLHPQTERAFDLASDRGDRLDYDIPVLTPLFRDANFKTATARVDGEPWHVAAERVHFDSRVSHRFLVIAYALPESAFALPAEQVARLVAFGLLATLLFGALLTLTTRHMFQPLTAVTNAAGAIAAGSRTVELPRNARGETAALVDAFRVMAKKVAVREDDYQRLNAELEERVRQRTAALQRAARVIENTSEGVLITDENGVILSVNRAFEEITGFSAVDAVGRNPSLLRSDHHDHDFYAAMWRELKARGRWQGEIWNRRKNGEAYLQRMTIDHVPADDGGVASFVSVFEDVTSRHQEDQHLRHLAFHDPLTGLANRALLFDRLQHALAHAKRTGTRLSVTFMDLDGFKIVNDSLGHDIGDLLLQEVAQRIAARMRAMDTVARLGGDEFVIVMEILDAPKNCGALAAQIIADVSQPLEIRGHAVHIGASMGIAFYPEDGGDADELMKHADAALYAAKAAGKGTYRFHQGIPRVDAIDIAAARKARKMRRKVYSS